MNLAKTDLPTDTVRLLHGFNIREVESLLSMLATPNGLVALGKVLKMPVESLQTMAVKLRSLDPNPNIDIPPATAEPRYAMGHRPPSPRNDSGRE